MELEQFPTQLFLVLNPSVRSCGSCSQSEGWSENRAASVAMQRGPYGHMIQKSLGQSAPCSQLATDVIGQQGQSARRRVQYGKSAQHRSLASGRAETGARQRGPERGPERGQRVIGRGARTATHHGQAKRRQSRIIALFMMGWPNELAASV